MGDTVGGIAVPIGARVMAKAGADEVLVSSTVKDLVVRSGIKFKDRGAHRLKGVSWRNGAYTGYFRIYYSCHSALPNSRLSPTRPVLRWTSRAGFPPHARFSYNYGRSPKTEDSLVERVEFELASDQSVVIPSEFHGS